MDARQLRVLVELAERGTLRAVASATGYGTSAVSQQLAGLERAVNADLVEPDGRRLRLTPAGRAFLPHARRILAEMDRARLEVASGDQPAGTVRVAGYGSALREDLVPVVRRLRDSHPAVRLELYEREPVEAMRLVRAGRVELALVYGYSLVPPREDPGTSRVVLCEVPMVLAVPAGPASPPGAGETAARTGAGTTAGAGAGREASGRIAAAADLEPFRRLPWIVNSREHDDAEVVRRFTAPAGFTPDLAHRVDSLDVIQHLVAAGLGVALVPATVRAHPGIRLLPVTMLPLSRRMLAVSRTGHADWPATALVRQMVAEQARGHAPWGPSRVAREIGQAKL